MSTIVTRAGQGSALTNTEVDANFTNLNNDKAEKANNLSDLASPASARTNLGFTDPIINKAAPGPIGATTPSTGGFTNLTSTGTATLTNVNPNFVIKAEGGSEGGQFKLEKPASGTTLTHNIHIDVAADAFRVFESGGSTRGAILPLASCSASAGSQFILNDVAQSLSNKTFSNAFGYGIGAGGQVTQTGSKSTTVTLNKPTGIITMHNASLAANTSVMFVFNNDKIGGNDTIVCNVSWGGFAPDSYTVDMHPGSGSIRVVVKNVTGSPLSEAVQINFAIIKGSAN